MKHEMKLKNKYFDMIKAGEKIYEVRLNDEKRRLLHEGDELVFKREPELEETLTTIIKDLIYFESFHEMASTIPAEKVGFANMGIGEIVDVYHEFYDVNDEQKYGVVAIKVVVQ